MKSTYTMLDLLKSARDVVKGHGAYSGHAIEVHQNGVSLVVYYTPKDAEAEISACVGFPSSARPGRFERSMAL